MTHPFFSDTGQLVSHLASSWRTSPCSCCHWLLCPPFPQSAKVQTYVIHMAPGRRTLPLSRPPSRSTWIHTSKHLLLEDFYLKMSKQRAYMFLAHRANTKLYPTKELRHNTGQTVTLGVMLMSYHSVSWMSAAYLCSSSTLQPGKLGTSRVTRKNFSKQAPWHSNTESKTYCLKGPQYLKCADDSSFH